MGFNKRFVDSDIITTYLSNNTPLKTLFKADAFIFMDDVASNAFKWFQKGLTDQEIKLKLSETNGKKSE
jgi:hypothetical protein